MLFQSQLNGFIGELLLNRLTRTRLVIVTWLAMKQLQALLDQLASDQSQVRLKLSIKPYLSIKIHILNIIKTSQLFYSFIKASFQNDACHKALSSSQKMSSKYPFETPSKSTFNRNGRFRWILIGRFRTITIQIDGLCFQNWLFIQVILLQNLGQNRGSSTQAKG